MNNKKVAVTLCYYSIGKSSPVLCLLEMLCDYYQVDLHLYSVRHTEAKVMQKIRNVFLHDKDKIDITAIPADFVNNYDFYIAFDANGFVLCKRLFPDSHPIYYSLELYFRNNAYNLSYPETIMLAERKDINSIKGLMIQSEEREKLFRQEYSLLETIPTFLHPVTYMQKSCRTKSDYFRRKFAIPNDTKIALHLGGIQEQHCLIEIAESFRYAYGWVLILHGNAFGDYKLKLKKHIEKNGLSNVLISEEFFENLEDMDIVVQASDAGIAWYKNVSPNFTTAGKSSGKITAYLRFGLPVIVNRYRSTVEAIEETGCGICVDDFAGIPEALEQISINYNLFSENALQEYDKTYWFENYRASLKCFIESEYVLQNKNDKFTNIQLSTENIDLYHIRTSIKKALDDNLDSFQGVLLDIGCGEMPYKDYLLKKSRIDKYIGMDIENPEYQKKIKPDVFWDGIKIPLADNSVDTVMATEVFEHTPVIDSVLNEIFRVLKPSGTLFFTVPYLWPLHDVPHDEYRYTPFSLGRHFKIAGYENINIKATGGWDAALAQMIGLWLRRRPMSEQERKGYADNMFNLYKDLLAADQIPQNYDNGPMITGLAGTVSKPAFVGLQNKFSPNRIFSMLNQVKYSIEPKQSPKVVIVVNLFPTVTETFILDQIVGLIKRGVNLEIWAQSNPQSVTIHPDVISHGLLKITKYLRLPKISISDSNRWYQKFLEQNPELNFDNISLFHVHFGQNFNNLSPIYLLNKKPVIVSFHGLDASQYIKTNGPGCYEQLFQRANTITTPSYEMKNVLIANGCAEAKIKIHRYGVDLDKFKPSLQSHNNKVTTLLSVARFVEKKGMIYALQAIASLSHFNFVYRIIGEGHLEAELKSAVEKLGIQDKVKFLGTKSKDEIVQEMQTADIYILTSITASNGDKEGLPVTLIESQAVGLPAVTTYHSGIPELVKNEISGLVCEEKDVLATAKNIERLILSKGMRYRLSANARIIVQREFNIELLNDSLKDLYLELTKENSQE